MAEISMDSLVTPRKYEFDERSVSKDSYKGTLSNGQNTDTRRKSVGSNHDRCSSLRRSCTEKSHSPNAVPRYLRASTGSCHDFCMYGRDHSFETEARKPFRRRVVKPSPVRIDGGSEEEEVVVSGCRKKDETVSNGRKKDEAGDSETVSSGRKKDEASDSPSRKPSSPHTKPSHAKPKKFLDLKKATKHKLPSPDFRSSNEKPNFRRVESPSNTEAYSSKKNDSSGSKVLLPGFKPSYSKKSSSSDPPEIIKSVFFPYTQVEDQKLIPIRVKSSSSYDDSDGMRGKGTRLTTPAKKDLASSSATPASKLSPNKTAQSQSGSLKIASSLKDRIRIRRVVNEKTLHVISSPPSSSLPFHKGDELMPRKEAHAKENRNQTRKSRAVAHEEKHDSPVKVVDLRSDNNTPRRLRFRRARVLGAKEIKGDSRGKDSQKVVLKHQDLQGRKDGQGLLNNVIEETASRLAVSRKSKVKALVGAFEAVTPSVPLFVTHFPERVSHYSWSLF